MHASQCNVANSDTCSYPHCFQMRKLFRHAHQCKLRCAGGCQVCKKSWMLLKSHSKNCEDSNCRVPRCLCVSVKFSNFCFCFCFLHLEIIEIIHFLHAGTLRGTQNYLHCSLKLGEGLQLKCHQELYEKTLRLYHQQKLFVQSNTATIVQSACGISQK